MLKNYPRPAEKNQKESGHVLSAQGISKIYQLGEAQVRALKDISIDIEAGTFTTIMGPSGSGKSTLLQCLSTLDQPTTGTIQIGGKETTKMSDNKLSRLRSKRMGFIFQAYNLIDVLTVRQNIELPSKLVGRRVKHAALTEVCESLGLAERLDHLPGQLSGGQQQRTAIARAMVNAPDVVFADEPTGALDVKTGKRVLALLRECTQRGQSVVMVTHDLSAARSSDRVVLLIDGRIALDYAHPTQQQWDTIRTTLDERA